MALLPNLKHRFNEFFDAQTGLPDGATERSYGKGCVEWDCRTFVSAPQNNVASPLPDIDESEFFKNF